MNLIRFDRSLSGIHPLCAWEPLDVVRRLASWDALDERGSLAGGSAPAAGTFGPAFDVHEEAGAFLFVADLPGVADADLEVQVTGNQLSIAGKRPVEHQDGERRTILGERRSGSFARAFTLPDGVDGAGVVARLAQGVLSVRVPKREEAQPRRIAVARGDAAVA